jgi:hypothetical protein
MVGTLGTGVVGDVVRAREYERFETACGVLSSSHRGSEVFLDAVTDTR